MRRNNVIFILNCLYDAGYDSEYCSPNFVANFAYNQGIELLSAEVVEISDFYGTENCPTGRIKELQRNSK